MKKTILVAGAIALAVVSRADVFDGTAGQKIVLPSFNRPVIAHPVEQSGADLYYFTEEEAAQALKTPDFRAYANGYTFSSEVPAEIQTQMRADLAFVAQIKGSGATPLHRKIFGLVDGAAYAEFFETRVSLIGMSGCGSGNAVACVMPMLGHSRMWLSKNYIKFSHPQISRMMVVYHEARHTEMSKFFWSHAKCPSPFKDAQGNDMKSIWTGAMLAGEPACDKTPLGSYGSSAIMLKNIAKYCTNCTDKVKMDASLYADDQMGRIIDARAKRQMQDDFAR